MGSPHPPQKTTLPVLGSYAEATSLDAGVDDADVGTSTVAWGPPGTGAVAVCAGAGAKVVDALG